MKPFLKSRKLFVILIPALIFFSIFSTGCGRSTDNPYTVTGFYFDTAISISLYDRTDGKRLEEAGQDCLDLCSKYEQLLSAQIDTSDIGRINLANGSPTEVSEETADLIRTALTYSALSGGSFQITIAPLCSLWDITGENPQVPDSADIAAKLAHIDDSCVLVSGNTVTLTDPDAQIDLGGIAKGYIADRLRDLLSEKGIRHALINLGGNILAIGGKTDGSDYSIGLQKPFDERGDAIASVALTDGSVVTSGSYERYFEENGKLYHHIMDPSTGYPAESGLHAVTILSKDSVIGDALSTACFVLGPEKGMELIDSLPDVYAVFITDENQLLYSDGAKKACTIKEL